MSKSTFLAATLLAAVGLAGSASAVTVQIDYSLDTSNWFGPIGSPQRQTVEAAADFFSVNLVDTLDAIIPDAPDDPANYAPGAPIPGSIWAGILTHPSTGASHRLPGLEVPEDTILVYVGARDLGGSELGRGGPGGFDAKAYTANWFDLIRNRGEEGITNGSGSILPNPTDFAPWGGALTFDTTDGTSDRNWHLDHTAAVPAGANDLFSVALHEIGHLLGFGTSPAFDALVDSALDTFKGPAANAAWGGDPPLKFDESHWLDEITSPTYAGGPTQETAMDPDLTVGDRKRMTELDMAAFDDIGWELASFTPPAGDLDGDLDVDTDDLNILLGNWGLFVSAAEGNLNGTGIVDDLDLGLLLGSWTGNLSGDALLYDPDVQVPEPATLALLGTSLIFVARRRRR